MRQSQFLTKTSKENPKDEVSRSAVYLMRAGFIDKLAAGIYSFLPLGLKVLNKVNNIVREEMSKLGSQEILMPALTPKENWQITGRYDTFDALMKLKGADDKDYVLGATHEEIVTPLVQRFASSYKDLPTSVFQLQVKFRNEKRAKGGLLRGREFTMKDMYSFHTNQEDLDNYYNKATEAYKAVYNRVGLGDITYLTYASGGAFSKYSHEFQTLAEAGEDEIYICSKCQIAINKEIISEQNSCPLCGNTELEKKNAIEVGNIFKLGNKFTKAFSYNFRDAEDKSQEVLMGCYGIGLSRLVGSIAEVTSDDKGLAWPESVAPFKVHLISLNSNEEALKVYEKLISNNVEVLVDDRDLSAGEKFSDADLIGCPLRAVVSVKSLAAGGVEIKYRVDSESKIISIDDFISLCSKK